MKKNDEIILTVTAQGNDGEGIAKIDGFPVFVKDTVAGDRILAGITKVKNSYAYARLIKLLDPSEDRVEPPCPISKRCGGCQLQAMGYEAQMRYKEKKVHDCLRRIGGLSEEELAMAAEPIQGMDIPLRYRNKAQYPVGYSKDGRIIAGFYAANSHSIVECGDCLLSPPEFSGIVSAVIKYMEENNVRPYDEVSGKGLVRHILIRKGFGTGQIMVCLVINGRKLPHEEELIEALAVMRAEAGICSLVINVNTDRTNVIMGKETRTVYGEAYIEDVLCGLRFRISASAFYQVNPVQAAAIYEKAIEYACLSGDEEVWDICSGIGTITLLLARKAGNVYGIEIVPDAVRDAVANAGLNSVDNAEFICDDVTKYVRNSSFAAKMHADVVVVDPPRKGLSPVVLETIISIRPSRIVYVSCEPATLARDLKYLFANGYGLKRYKPYDQFCETGHVETVVSLSLKSDSPKIEVSMKLGEDSLYEPQDKGTYEKIRAYVLEKYGFKVSNLYIAQTKDKCGLDKRLNYNLSKKDDPHVPECPKEKEDAIMDAFRHFGLIE